MVRYWFDKDLIWNYPAWSIQSEWFAYLFVFPVAYLCFQKERRLAVLIPATLFLLTLQWVFPFSFPGCEIIFLFLAGSALYRIRAMHPQSTGTLATVLGLLVVGLALSIVSSISLLFLYVGFSALILGLSYPRGVISRLLSSRLVVYGGTISYCLYMTHALVGKFYGLISHRIHPSNYWAAVAVFILLVLSLLGTAIAFHHLVEVPCNRALRAKVRTRPTHH